MEPVDIHFSLCNCDEHPCNALERIYGDRFVRTIWPNEVACIDGQFYCIHRLHHACNESFYELELLDGMVLMEDWFDPANPDHIKIISMKDIRYDVLPDNVIPLINWKETLIVKLCEQINAST